MKKILLIEDDLEICEMVKTFLTKEGFEIFYANDGESGCELFQINQVDLILLDIMMPKLDGFNVMQRIREKSTVPIIILSARDTEFDKVSGLGMGADDYITKPFSMAELSARIKSNLRRSIQYANQDIDSVNNELRAGDIVLKLNEFCIIKKDQKIELTSKEFEILKLLILNPTRVYTKAQLYSLVWDDNYFGDENTVNVQISRLRTKIEDDSKNPRYIKTIWGIGYRLGV
jgi:DNA-binding response OmpR family regulator